MCMRMYATRARATTSRMMMVAAFDRDDPLDAPCSTITLRRTNSSSSFGGTDMLHLASKRGAICQVMVQTARGQSEDGDGEAAQRGGEFERGAEAVALSDGADRERADADACVEGPHHRAERPCAPQRVGVVEDERGEGGVGQAEAGAEQNRARHQLPAHRGHTEDGER